MKLKDETRLYHGGETCEQPYDETIRVNVDSGNEGTIEILKKYLNLPKNTSIDVIIDHIGKKHGERSTTIWYTPDPDKAVFYTMLAGEYEEYHDLDDKMKKGIRLTKDEIKRWKVLEAMYEKSIDNVRRCLKTFGDLKKEGAIILMEDPDDGFCLLYPSR